MNYRHAFHAGNFADVFKHAVLARILVHLSEKPQPFRVIDTHAGAGLYDLGGEQASRTGEWRGGIGRLAAADLPQDLRGLVAPYLDAVLALNPGGKIKLYPGSPLVALAIMRAQDRLVACELEPRAAAGLADRLRRDRRAKAVALDGWQALKAYVPPKERRGLVLIDPPYEDPEEFEKLVPRLQDAHRKWATGVYAVWYPIKGMASFPFIRRLRQTGMGKMLRTELHVAPNQPGRFTGSGLIIINPPWRLADDLGVLLPGLLAALQCETSGQTVIETLSDKI
ncbi:MAG TPA: 23S rRNA (adenine(2030)-N(6))-methyltransferase RlmJ [Xanthobacteraceae bacterium]|nr:23S rRNA (adenine(2030)-N(6))-methyltransferase RlmJ [Xanthobacteraceae bacterium]